MVRLLLMTLSLIGIIAVNIAASVLPLNGQTTGEISNRLPVLFTPAGYVFSIWSVIYVLLTIWIISYWRRFKKGTEPAGPVAVLFFASAVFNIGWLFAWHYEQFILSFILIAGYFASLLLLYFRYSKGDRMRIPISINLAWLSVASLSNLAYVLTYYNWNGWGLSDALWTVIMLTAAAAFALHIRYHYSDPVFPLVFIWAFIGIAVRNGFNELLVFTASLFLSGVLAAGIAFIKKKQA